MRNGESMGRGGSAASAIVVPPTEAWNPAARKGTGRRLVHLARTKPLGTFALAVITIFVFTAIFASALVPYNPYGGTSGVSLLSPRFAHPFGTDAAGRDVLSRVIYGSRASLWTSLVAVGLGTLCGTAIGIVSGLAGGWFDTIVQRFVDAAMSIPLILLAVVIVSLVKPSLNNILFALSFAIVPGTSRIVRGSTLAIKQEPYVESARAVGCIPLRIVLRYILPNIFAPIVVLASVTMGAAIIAESSLNFLGLGSPTLIDWGGMLSSGRDQMETAPWLAVFPGLAIMITVLAFNLLGDAIRDVLDPRLRV